MTENMNNAHLTSRTLGQGLIALSAGAKLRAASPHMLRRVLPWVGLFLFLGGSPAENASSDEIQINSVDVGGSGAQIRVEYPAGLTNRLDIFTTGDLLGRWGLVRTNILPTGTDLVTSVDSGNGNAHFFVVGTDQDSDGDGLSDMRERLLYQTSPTNWDSDGDTIGDYDEAIVFKTDPRDPTSVPRPGKIVVQSVSDSPDPFSPAQTNLSVVVQYRIRPTDGFVGSSHGQNGMTFYVRQVVEIADGADRIVRTLRGDFPIDPAGTMNAAQCVSISTVAVWDGKDEQGIQAPDGPYTYRVTGIYVRVNEHGPFDAAQGRQEKVIDVSEAFMGTVLLDATRPEIRVANRTPAANAWGWNNSPVTVSYAVADALSDVDTGKGGYEPDVVTAEGEGQTVAGSVTDLAGNTASITVDGINIDLTPPEILAFSPAEGGTTADPRQVLQVTFRDILSGINTGAVVLAVDGQNVTPGATLTATNVLYQPAVDFAEGNHTAVIYLRDRADNVISGSVTFTAVYVLPDGWQIKYFGSIGQNGNADPDNDGLNNFQEYWRGTDPLNPDTDRDGFADGRDREPVSRAFIEWGNPKFTVGDDYLYAMPAWVTRAYKDGGQWVETTAPGPIFTLAEAMTSTRTNPVVLAQIDWEHPDVIVGSDWLWMGTNPAAEQARCGAGWLVRLYEEDGQAMVEDISFPLTEWQARTLLMENPLLLPYIPEFWNERGGAHFNPSEWYVSATNPPDTGSLNIILDRNLINSNLVMDIQFMDYAGSSLYVDLLTAGYVEVATDLYGNLMTGTGQLVERFLDVPLESYPQASIIHVRRGVGEIAVGEMFLYVDQDHDGLDAGQEAMLGSSDFSGDSDGDLFSDYNEVFLYHTDPADPASFPANISGTIFNNSSQTTGVIRVVASLSSNLWPVEYSTTISGPGPYSITNLPTLSNYWVFAYVDRNSNGTNEPWEATGSYAGNPIHLTGNLSGADLTIENPPDANANGIPDTWEAYYFGSITGADAAADPDNDGLNNLQEFLAGTDPWNPDTDGDGRYDGGGYMHIKFSAISLATEGSGIKVAVSYPDDYTNRLDLFACSDLIKGDWKLVLTTNADVSAHRTEWTDPGSSTNPIRFYAAGNADITPATDPDGDGLPWAQEKFLYHTSPTNSDSDADGMPDGWEVTYGLNPTNALDATLDSDHDGLSNRQEYEYGTDPTSLDSDDDRVSDGEEVAAGTDPSDPASHPARTLYVRRSGSVPAPPFDSWEAAAADIQTAITVAETGDIVLVTNGVYEGQSPTPGVMGNVVTIDKAIWVKSVNGPAATVIRPTPGAHTIRCAYVGPGATLSGFGLTGGMADPADWWDWWRGTGGGALCEGDGTISNCTVEGNYATGNGGGVYGGFIVDSRVMGNTCDYQAGGGVYGAALTRCEIIGNTVLNPAEGLGGGLYGCTADRCLIRGNWVGDYSVGGGAADSTLTGCVIAENDAGQWGGGVAYGTLENCTLVGNTAGLSGGGAFQAVLRNCIAYYNTVNFGVDNGSLDSAMDYCCTYPAPPAGEGNITAEPQLADWVNGDYHLLPTSPCIDAGLNQPWMSSALDLDGQPRMMNGRVDIGADEYGVLKCDIVPDWNHDRKIDDDDKTGMSTNTFHFWINDDVDSGDVAGLDSHDTYDCPVHWSDFIHPIPNCERATVCGRRDLVDFFPVWLDLHDTLNILPPSGTVQYKLKQADEAVKAVYTDLTKDHAGDYLTTDGSTYGPTFDQPSYTASVFTVTSAGVTLSTDFLNKIKNDATKGVLLMEGVSHDGTPSSAPLILEVWKDGQKICEKQMPLSFTSVTSMFRYLNLRPVAGDNNGGNSQTNEPPNNPDSLSNNKHVVFIHGFNESADDGLGNGCETFKRLYWSGSRAKYTAVVWRGDQDFPAATHYHRDVTNAFITAPQLASYINNLHDTQGQEVNVIAFSLGNMVVSSAIQDYGAHVDRYFLLHAAMAMEAYDSSEFAGNMIQNDWAAYTNRLYASNWNKLWDADPTDGRHGLTWRGRFANVIGSQTYNFYSSEDDVLDNCVAQYTPLQTILDHILHWDFNFRRYAWSCQELYKGRYGDWIGGSTYGGWGFVAYSQSTNYFTNSVIYAPDAAAQITPDALKAVPFFNSAAPVPSLLVDPTNSMGSGSAYAVTNQNRMLAEMIPALSFATGRNYLNPLHDSGNFDMNATLKANGWPDARFDPNPPPGHDSYPWIHGDHRSVAYFYVYPLFEKISKDLGGFNQ